jgi:hypothetical protein
MPTPGARCSASAMLGSGKRPIASDEMMVTVLSAVRCWLSGIVEQRGAGDDDVAALVAGGGQGQRDVATPLGRGDDMGDGRAAEIVDQQRDIARRLGRDDAEFALEIGGRLRPRPLDHDPRAGQRDAGRVIDATRQDRPRRRNPRRCAHVLRHRPSRHAGQNHCDKRSPRETAEAGTDDRHDGPPGRWIVPTPPGAGRSRPRGGTLLR